MVSVIIPARDSEATIERCLKSILRQSYRNIEIILVDNYSRDRTRDISVKHSAKVFLKGPERSAQVNFGAGKAAGKYLYRVDSDFVVQRNVIQEAVESSESNNYDAIIIHNTSDPTVSLWARIRKIERDCYRNDMLNVASRFWKKEVFEEIGGFDENLSAAEDYDLHNRLINRGSRIGQIKAEEIHIREPKTLAQVARTHYYYGKSIRVFLRKNPNRALLQLSPLRRSHSKALRNLLCDPILPVGFALYQFVRYTAALLGVMSSILTPTPSIQNRSLARDGS
ncbi:glycosyltransferase [Candidatus Bathyarchaeota archaeon]|nr:glycosyltransferase [Candidatus Bathyarchaeota archaeon]